MKIIVSNNIHCEDIPQAFADHLRDRLTFENPRYLDNEKMSRWNGDTPRYLQCFEETDTGLIIPRGFAGQLCRMAQKQNISFQINDQRRTLPEVDFTFTGTLRPYQQQAVNAMLVKDFGTLNAPTGSGKTVMQLVMIAARRQSALIVVHTKELLNQWCDRIETFLNIPRDEIGAIGGGKFTIGDKITVTLVQSLYKVAHEVKDRIGYLIIDECHRAPSRTFTEAMTAFDCRYMTGLSATPWRRDGLSRLIYWYLGDLQHEIKSDELKTTGALVGVEIIVRETDFHTAYNPSEEYSKMLSELTQDYIRNRLIASDVVNETKISNGICLVLSDRKKHCQDLHRLISCRGINADVLTGDLSNNQRQEVIERLQSGQVKVLCATGQLIGEGFDLKELSTVFFVTPIKFNGRVIQYLGRVLRPAPGKDKARVFDYVDPVGVLIAAARSRQRVYEGMAA